MFGALGNIVGRGFGIQLPDPAITGDNPVDVLRSMLSNSATFQAWTGTVSAVTALDYIHVVEVDADDIVRPLAIIDDSAGEAWASTRISTGHYTDGGSLFILFEQSVDESDTEQEALADFDETIRGCVYDMQGLAPSGTIAIHEVTYETPPMRATDDKQAAEGDYYRARLQVVWGV